jgi:hypothetical protein
VGSYFDCCLSGLTIWDFLLTEVPQAYPRSLVIHAMDVGQRLLHGPYLHQTRSKCWPLLVPTFGHLTHSGTPDARAHLSLLRLPNDRYRPAFRATGVHGFFEANRGIDTAVVTFFSHANRLGPSPFIVGISLH